ncbi:hypothetical protein PG996_008979 [Apiospora saccharicola]|uniref:Uncharacterized protein n=1 Tax=Apiospora saccharicola TaxID=335842 RepID=A0ABR1V077_9PEZI
MQQYEDNKRKAKGKERSMKLTETGQTRTRKESIPQKCLTFIDGHLAMSCHTTTNLVNTAGMAQKQQASLKKGHRDPEVTKCLIERPNSDTTMNMEIRAVSNLMVPDEDDSKLGKVQPVPTQLQGRDTSTPCSRDAPHHKGEQQVGHAG